MTINKAEHFQRLLTAALGFIIIALLYFLLRHTAVQLVAVFISLVSFYEYLQCLLSKENTPFLRTNKICIGILAATIFLLPLEKSYIWSMSLLVISFLALYRFLPSHSENHSEEKMDEPFHIYDLFVIVFGIFYICGFTMFLTDIHLLPDGPFWLLFLLLIIWADDIAAYYGGHKFGKRKLAPTISPGKTIEGSCFGILGALFVCAVAYLVHKKTSTNPEYPSIGLFFILGLVTSIIAQIGDLFESLLKRIGGIKNSGSLLPGHGGVFDRFDSMILAAPIYYFFLRKWIV